MRRVRERGTDAVSPVIGVMLMIVVTIIIAAIVSAFAGGFSDQQKKAPSAQIEATLQHEINTTGIVTSQLVFTHKGGDPVDTRDLQIVTFVNDQKHVTDGSLAPDGSNDFEPSQVGGVWPALHFVSNNGYPCRVNSNGVCLDDGKWGDTTFMNGDVMTTDINDPTSLQSIIGTSSFVIPTTSSYKRQNGIPFTLEIVHIPSGRVISSTELVYT